MCAIKFWKISNSLVLFWYWLLQAQSAEARKAEEMLQRCETQEQVTENDIRDFLHQKRPSTTTGKCLHACLMETVGLVSGNEPFLYCTFSSGKNIVLRYEFIYNNFLTFPSGSRWQIIGREFGPFLEPNGKWEC